MTWPDAPADQRAGLRRSNGIMLLPKAAPSWRRSTLTLPSMATPPTSPSQTARFQEKREAILGAAASLFNELGVRATLSGIAASVGLVTNSVTYYYRKKEDLATACFLRSIDVIDAIVHCRAGRLRLGRIQRFFP